MIQARMILKNKRTRKIKINEDDDVFYYKEGLYVVPPEYIKLDDQNRAEIFYFENNPTPINREENDNSGNYLNDMIDINFIENLDSTGRSHGPGILAEIRKNPQLLVISVMVLTVLYAIWASGGKLI